MIARLFLRKVRASRPGWQLTAAGGDPKESAAEKNRRIRVAAVDFGPFALLSLPFEVDHKDGDEIEAILTEIAQKPVYLLCYTGGYDGYLPSGKPLSVDSSYEDIASRYLPESREQVWECAKQCVLQAKQH